MLSLACALVLGCGVSFSSAPKGTEFFKALAVTGPLDAGKPLTVAVSYQQAYPVNTIIKCEIRQGKSLVKDLGAQTAPAHPTGNPKATPFPGNFSFDAVLDEPGEYKAECFTPADEDNFILKTFRVKPSVQATTGG